MIGHALIALALLATGIAASSTPAQQQWSVMMAQATALMVIAVVAVNALS